MGEELRIDSAKVKRLAEELAARTGESILQAVEHALEARLAAVPPRVKKTPAELAQFWDELQQNVERHRAAGGAELTSDHSDLYDEYGLPK